MFTHDISQIEIRLVPLRDIDDQDDSFLMSYGFDLRPLMLSIRKAGLLNSPLLLETKQSRLLIVCGFRRILSLKALGWNQVPCRIIRDSDIFRLDCLRLNLFDNLTVRKFNEIEKGMVLRRLFEILGEDMILADYMPLLELSSHKPTLDFYCTMDQQLEVSAKEALVRGQVSLNTVKRLLDMSKDDRSCFLELLSKIKFNTNQQKYLIEYILDMASKLHVDICNILRDVVIGVANCEKRMNDPQQADSILRALRSRLFPKLCWAEEIFRKKTAKLNLPGGTKIYHPPSFESPHYRLEILFRDGHELKARIDQLHQINEISILGDPWEEDA